MFSKILIANRGEIAVRIIRACREMGIETAVIYSTADVNELHVSMADEAYCIGGPLPKDSYLNMDSIIALAKNIGAEAIHPGYGLLSENPEFARRCEEEKISFIGPSSSVIALMGHKEKARAVAMSAGLPLIMGSPILKNADEAREYAEKIGYPIILKARSGGGGKGIRVVFVEEDLDKSWNDVVLESESAFGDDAIFMEKYLESARHIEVQLLADSKGNVKVLLDRDCSVQNKNQKVIEECPAPGISGELRKKLHNAAIKLCRYAQYVSVGTVEFLVSKEDFYFLEMNTRLQVEHSVSEMVTGVDIVKWQIRIAAGVELEIPDEEIREDYHAIECRICSTDGAGELTMLHVPGGMNVRFDTALYAGCKVSPFYDSMLGKLIVGASTRQEAIRKMRASLSELILLGINTNQDLHMKLLSDGAFVKAEYDTGIYKKVIG